MEPDMRGCSTAEFNAVYVEKGAELHSTND